MTCSAARELFSRDVDDRLGPAERSVLASHLTGCAACRDERQRWGAIAHALRVGGPAAVPPWLALRSWEAAIRSAPPPPLSSWFVTAARPAALAGALAAVLAWAIATSTEPSKAAAAQDPMELAVHLWMSEVGADVP